MAHDPREEAEKPDKQEPGKQRDDYDEDTDSHDRESEAGQSDAEKLQRAWEEAQDGTSRPIPPAPRPTTDDKKKEKR
jgi:hypothetical protein